ncbi:MAG: Alvin_2107 family globule sulfur oxidation protein [Gammaproteobacteria bacterium]
MTDENYYDTIDRLEKAGIDREYIQGWIGGYLGNPAREEQRLTDAYTAGYADGEAKCTDAAETWKG